MSARPEKTQVSLGIYPVWSESLLGAHSFFGFVMSWLICQWKKIKRMKKKNIDIIFRLCKTMNEMKSKIEYLGTNYSLQVSWIGTMWLVLVVRQNWLVLPLSSCGDR